MVRRVSDASDTTTDSTEEGLLEGFIDMMKAHSYGRLPITLFDECV